jgi:hypothetical protein
MARCASAMPWMAWAGSPGASDWHSTYSDLGGWFDADGGPGIARAPGGGGGGGAPRARAKRDRHKVSMTKKALALMESNGKQLERRAGVKKGREEPRAAHVELPRLSNLVQQYVFAADRQGGALLPAVHGAGDTERSPAQQCPMPSPCREDCHTRGASLATASAATTRPGRDASTCRGPPATSPKSVDSKHLYGQLASSPIAGFPDSNRYMTESRKAQLLATNELLRRRNQALKDAHARAATLPVPEAAHGALRYLSSRAQERAAAQQPVSPHVKMAATGPAVLRRHRAAEQRIPIHLSDAVGSPTLPPPVVVEKCTRLPAYMSSGRLFADKTTNLGLQSPNGRTQAFDTTWGASLIGGARNTNVQLV